MQANDIIELNNTSIGVISEQRGDYYRVEFVDSRQDVLPEQIAATLEPATYAVNDEISVWPDLGTITAIDGNSVSVDVEHSDIVPNVGPVEWIGHHDVPLWRVIRDNDPRIQRNDYGNRN